MVRLTQARIHLSGQGFGRSAAGLVYAEICLQLGELRFPDSRWTDFVVVVLTGWCDALCRLWTGERGPIEVRFMEGPYVVEVGPINRELVHVVFVEAGLTRLIRCDTDVHARTFTRSVLSGADRTIAECRTHGWWSDDAEKLIDARDALRAAFQDH